MTRAPRLVAAVSVALLSITACAAAPAAEEAFCVPRITVEPQSVAGGDTIILTSDDFCGAEMPEEGWAVSAAPQDRIDDAVVIRSTEEFDGAFRVDITLPIDFSAGPAFAGIDGWDYSGCPDDASCASPTGDFVVEP